MLHEEHRHALLPEVLDVAQQRLRQRRVHPGSPQLLFQSRTVVVPLRPLSITHIADIASNSILCGKKIFPHTLSLSLVQFLRCCNIQQTTVQHVRDSSLGFVQFRLGNIAGVLA